MKYEIKSTVRPEECKRYIIFMPRILDECERNVILMLSEVHLNFFFEKIKNKGPKIHCLALKFYTGASKSGSRGANPRGPYWIR